MGRGGSIDILGLYCLGVNLPQMMFTRKLSFKMMTETMGYFRQASVQ